MLVSKIKPCMSQCKPYALARLGETAKGSLNQLWFLGSYHSVTWITVVILELIHADRVPTAPCGRNAFIRSKPIGVASRPRRQHSVPFAGADQVVTLNNFVLIARSQCWRCIFQMSALSTVDGRLCAYHGGNG